MAATLKRDIPSVEIEMVEGRGGNFIVDVGPHRVWHKREMRDRFPDEAEMVVKIRELAGS